MEMEGNTLAIVLLVVGLVVGAGAGYFLAPSGPTEGEVTTEIVEKLPLEGKTIQLGYIASQTTGLETAVPLIKEIMEPDYNNYTEKLGYDVTFE